MNLPKVALSALAAALVLAAPNIASAGEVVPQSNPAATQYTEAFPTSQGPADSDSSHHKKSPDQVLGDRNAKKLEAEGKDGRETARVAAETAPASGGARAGDGGSGSGAVSGAANGNGRASGGGSSGGAHASGEGPEGSAPDSAGSGLGNVAGQASGFDTSDGTGLLLPLVILGILVWAAVYVLGRRRRTAQ
jgi:hypothetical protein